MNYRQIIDRMERNGDYSAAREYEDRLRDSGISEHDRVDRSNPADGAQHSYAGDRAEEAFRDLRSSERRAEERREEQEREEMEMHQREREHYEQAQQEQEQEP